MTSHLHLYNSLTRKKEPFIPLDESNIRMYVCGPTVYDRAHIGNARAVVVYDVLYRLLQHLYPKVTYVRNITDVDDKINAAAKANGEPISALTERVTSWFHEDMAALGNLPPTIEPRATQEIPAIIALIERILANEHAYISQGHVLFDVGSMKAAEDYHYGKLSGKKLEDLIAGARVQVESYKRNPADFVLWKPAEEGDDPSSVFDSPWGQGRPGWHIECSAMSSRYLGNDFDIHGGGADLKFPHHENEIAQSRCGHPESHYAKYWVHNGFVTVNGEKMSKSLGNFITVKDLLDKGIKGEVIRYALLSAKYNEPLDWTEKRLEEARKALDYLYRAYYRKNEGINAEIADHPDFPEWERKYEHFIETGEWNDEWTGFFPKNRYNEAFEALCDDMNTHSAFQILYKMSWVGASGGINSNDPRCVVPYFSYLVMLKKLADMMGFLKYSETEWFGTIGNTIQELIDARTTAKKSRNFAEADRIRKELAEQGIILEDSPQGTTWRRG